MKKGEVYYAAVPYLPEAPLSFFIEDEDKPGYGKIVEQLPEDRLRGKTLNKERNVVLPFKRRMVLVVSGDAVLKHQPSAIVMPIHTIYPEQVNTHPFYHRLVYKNKSREAFCLGTPSGRMASVSILELRTISKNLIYDKVDWALTAEEMIEIDYRLADCLNNSVVLACQVCDKQCGKCELLRVAYQFKTKKPAK